MKHVMNRFVRGTALSCLILLTLCVNAPAQSISVSVPVIMLNEQSWSADIRVKNLSPAPVSIISAIAFTVVRSDADGRVYLDSAETWEEMSRSCAAWLKISPRELILPASSWRTLRVSIASPGSLSEGEFWGSLIIRSASGGHVETAARTDTSIIPPPIDNGELSIPIVVRKGTVRTGMEIRGITAIQQGTVAAASRDSAWNNVGTTILVDARRLGNGAYRGTMMASIRREDRTEVATSRRQFSLFWDRRLRFDFPRLKDGLYVLALESRTETQADDPELPLPSPPVHKDVRIHVHGSDVRVIGF